jgi:hypothetical protein
MKTIYYLILLCILKTSIFAQVQSNCEITSELEYYYKRDVADLAINRLFTCNSPDTNQIIIPQVHQDSIWRGLSAIYNALSIPERDSIFDIFCIHNVSSHTKMLLPNIYIKVDTSISWTNNWFNGEIVTGYNELDNFISNYNYSIYSIHPNYAALVIHSDTIINSYAVSDSLISFNGIETAGPIPMTIDANRIQYSVEGEYQYFTFTLAWGDCMAGCIYKHKWNFKVNIESCVVEYIGLEQSSNNELPNPINCNITSIRDTENRPSELISIFPNPSSDYVTITGENMVQVELRNEYGLLVQEYTINDQSKTLDIKNLKTGLYFIIVKRDEDVIIKKFIIK